MHASFCNLYNNVYVIKAQTYKILIDASFVCILVAKKGRPAI